MVTEGAPPTASRKGSCPLICPPVTGGFILSLVDCSDLASVKRVMSIPFRVAGPPGAPKVCLGISGYGAIAPQGPVALTYNEGDITSCERNVFAVWEDCDSTSQSASRVDVAGGPYADAVACYAPVLCGAKVESEMCLVAPAKEGRYVIRCISIPKCGTPFTRLTSLPFQVGAPADGACDAPQISGTVAATVQRCLPSELVKVDFQVSTPCGGLLCELDSVVFYLYGRSETIDHHGGLQNCVMERLYRGSIQIRAPLEEGCYDVAFYSFVEQRPAIIGSPIIVEAPFCEITSINHGSCGQSAGKHTAMVYSFESTSGIVFEARVDERVFSMRDRVLVYSEMANLAEIAFVEKPKGKKEHDGRRLFVTKSTCDVWLPGKFSVHYYSFNLRRTIGKLNGFISVTPPKSLSLPTATISVLKAFPAGASFDVFWAKEGNDTRATSLQERDCVVICPAEARDSVAVRHVDDPKSNPCLQLQYVRNQCEALFSFEGIPQPGSYVARYLVARSPLLRLCTSEATFCVCTSEEMPKFEKHALESVGQQELGPLTHRYKYDDDDDAAEERVGAAPHEGTDSAPSTSGSVLCTSSRGATTTRISGGVSTRSSQWRPARNAPPVVTAICHFTNNSEYEGAVMAPRACSTTDQVVVTYHITKGMPLLEDKIVLLPEDCSRVVSEVRISNANGRPKPHARHRRSVSPKGPWQLFGRLLQ